MLPYKLRFIFILSLLITVPLAYYSSIQPSAVYAADEGWYLEGQPVIEKENFVNDKCYFNQSLNITNGSASGSVTWSDCDGGKCGGTYTGSMTWTPPPSFMQPSTKINFTMTAKTNASNTCGSRSIGSGGWVKAEGSTIVKAIDESSPSATGTYTVPNGQAGRKLYMWATIGVANLHGTVYYNYVYKSTGPGAATMTQPTITPVTKPAGTEEPPSGPLTDTLPVISDEDALGAITRLDGNAIYVSADPVPVPLEKKKWVKIMPGKTAIRLGNGWTVRTTPGSETIITYKTSAVEVIMGKSLLTIHEEEETTIDVSKIWVNLHEGIARHYHNPNKAAEEKFKMETNLAIVGIRGTDFVMEATEQSSTVKVIAGKVEVMHKSSGAVKTINVGQQIVTTQTGLSSVSTYDISAEKNKWGSFDSEVVSLTTDTQGSTQLAIGTASQSDTVRKTIKVGPLSCFIATAAYGSETATELDTLRAFRDKVLLKSESGKLFVDAYYAGSPPMADFIAEHEEIRTLVREALLNPVVAALRGTQNMWDSR